MGLVAIPSFGWADFRVCNQTLDVINVAVGAWESGDWRSQGWWTIGPNQCATTLDGELTSQFIYVYARDVFNNSMLEGSTQFCLGTDAFDIRGTGDCLARGHIPAPFFEIDTRKSERWTFYLQAPEG